MSKKIAAFVAAVLSTACVGVAILLIGGAALFNPNGTVAAQSPAQSSSVTTSGSAANMSGSSSAQVQQLQALVQQYQQQLQAQNDQVQQAQRQMQMVQQLLQALQQRGLITITEDGQILINR